MAKQITGYRITVTEAYSIYEQGAGYSLEPWGKDTDYYKGGSEPVTVEILDDVEVASTQSGELALFRAGCNIGYPLSAAIIEGWAKILA